MAPLEPHFTFAVSSMKPDAFHVVRFSGSEGLSKLYEFDITLLSDDASIDLGRALSGTATLAVKRQEGGDLVWHGILRDFRQQQMVGKRAVYRAILAPKAWLLTISQHNRIFLNQDVAQSIRDCLTDGGLSQGLDFDLKTSQSYPRREYVCQYNETHLNFASRKMERNGLYYYFDQSGPMEKMVVTDTLNIHGPHPGGGELTYSDMSGLDAGISGKAVKNLQCEQRRVPREVLLKDYNYRTPSLDIQGRAQVSESGEGTVYAHGGHLRSIRQASFLAQMRAESIRCREQVFFGESNAPFLRPGYTAKLDNHYRSDFNQNYLIIEVKHEGSQESWLTSGLGVSGLGDRLFYRNAFAAIPASVQFRAEPKSPKPVIQGAILAVIDAEGSGKYAQLDEQGRYKVIMPFDLSGRKDGHASTWLRLMQPYAGGGHGMHLPLHKGTEVAVIHQEGDPDRPIIAGALHNSESPSVVTQDNQTMANITTAGGNRIHMEDREGSERILLHSSATGDFVRIGMPNDPPSPAGEEPKHADGKDSSGKDSNKDGGHAEGGGAEGHEQTPGIALSTSKWFKVEAATVNEMILGDKSEFIGGVEFGLVLGLKTEIILGGEVQVHTPSYLSYSTSSRHLRADVQKMIGEQEEVIAKQGQDIAILNDRVGDHMQIVGSLNRTVAKQTSSIASLTRDVGALNETIGEIDRFAGDITDKVGAMQQNIGDLTQTVGDQTSTLGSLQQTVGDQTQTMASMQQTVGDLQQTAATVQNMQAQVTQMSEDITVLSAAVQYT
ncbi:MAG: type VI secretion system Vgr family protein [Thermodesulfobacteriota bacterium]